MISNNAKKTQTKPQSTPLFDENLCYDWSMPRIAHFFQNCKEAAYLWYEKDADLMAATISYYAIFAVTPLLLITISLSSLLYGKEHVAQTFTEWGSILGPDLVALLTDAVANLELLSGNFATPFLGALFFSGMTIVMFNAFTTGLHNLWNLPYHGVFSWIKKSANSAEFIIAFEIYLLLLIGFYKGVETVPSFQTGIITDVLSIVVSIVLTTALFGLMYHLLPRRHPNFSARMVGAFVAGILFTAAKSLIGIYLLLTPVPGLFGAAGLLVVLLIWVYISVSIIYFGATLSYVLSDKKLL